MSKKKLNIWTLEHNVGVTEWLSDTLGHCEIRVGAEETVKHQAYNVTQSNDGVPTDEMRNEGTTGERLRGVASE